MKSSHKIVLGIGGILLLLGLMGGFAFFATEGTQLPGQDNGETEPANGDDVARWDARNVKLNVQVKNLSSDTVTSGTIHLYEGKPEEWKNQRTISATFNSAPEYYTSYSIENDGTTTIQETPGTYYAVIEVSGDYYAFKEINVPDGSESAFQGLTLDRYNNAPKLEKYTVHDRYSLGSKAFDLGVDSNSTSSVDLEARNTYTPSDNTEYRLWKAVIQTGDVDPTTDSNSDGIYDEGVSKAYIEISGGVEQSNAQKEVFFHPSNGIDMLGAPDKAELTQKFDGLTFDSDNSMTVETGVTAVETKDSGHAASDGDEILTDGENVFDVNFCDAAGNCNSVADVTG